MSTKYWDIYVLYIERCEKENYINDIDPNHYEMEWNHFWPRSIFGNWKVGHWLTKKQHAIASALQTLAFKENCMCAWHKQYLPPKLLELAWPYYCSFTKENGKKSRAEKDENGKSVNAVKSGKKSAAKAHEEKDENGLSVFAVEKCGSPRKAVIAISPNGSRQYFRSLSEAARFFGAVVSSIRYRLNKGPSNYKGKLFGYRFESADVV